MSNEMTPPDTIGETHPQETLLRETLPQETLPQETLAPDTSTERIEPLDFATSATANATPSPAPRTRWAAIVWGLFFAAIATTGLWLLIDTGRREDVGEWVTGLTPGTLVAVGLLIIGVLALVAGLAGLIRHAQRRLGRQESGHAA